MVVVPFRVALVALIPPLAVRRPFTVSVPASVSAVFTVRLLQLTLANDPVPLQARLPPVMLPQTRLPTESKYATVPAPELYTLKAWGEPLQVMPPSAAMVFVL